MGNELNSPFARVAAISLGIPLSFVVYSLMGGTIIKPPPSTETFFNLKAKDSKIVHITAQFTYVGNVDCAREVIYYGMNRAAHDLTVDELAPMNKEEFSKKTVPFIQEEINRRPGCIGTDVLAFGYNAYPG